jgi:hypothetical protein
VIGSFTVIEDIGLAWRPSASLPAPPACRRVRLLLRRDNGPGLVIGLIEVHV